MTQATTLLQCGDRTLDLSQPQLMGILNVTPDSFSDGGRHQALDRAIAQAEQMVLEGATIIDIGGESTRPGAAAVSIDEELKRTIPVISALARRLDVVLSIDTSKTEVMRQAIDSGVGLINDVRALQAPGALQVAATGNTAVCLMHMQGQPQTMQQAPHYENLLTQINAFFAERISACEQAGIERNRLLLDPGFGFGKSLEHNYQLLANLTQLRGHQLPLLIGLSRKSMIGQLLDRAVSERLVGSVVGALLAAQQGAEILRIHDVQATADAIKVWQQYQRFI